MMSLSGTISYKREEKGKFSTNGNYISLIVYTQGIAFSKE